MPQRRMVVNPHAVSIVDGAPPDRAALAYHRHLPGYAPTPLLDLPALAARYGVGRLWLKDESARLGLPAFKILGASWAVYRALVARRGGPFADWATLDALRQQIAALGPLTLVTATDGNHGRAVARVARLFGLHAAIFVPTDTAAARIRAIESEGATVTVVAGTYDDAVERAAAEASDRCLVISDTSWPGYTDVPGWVIEGYATIFHEVDDALAAREEPPPDLVVVQIGVGALASAVVRHYRRRSLPRVARILGVEPLSAACVLESLRAGEIVAAPGPHTSIMAGLNCGLPSLVAWPEMRVGLDCCIAIDDDETRWAMRALAAHGIVAGETGASGLGGLHVACIEPDVRAALDLTAESRVLLISTEGATDAAGYARIVGRAPDTVARNR